MIPHPRLSSDSWLSFLNAYLREPYGESTGAVQLGLYEIKPENGYAKPFRLAVPSDKISLQQKGSRISLDRTKFVNGETLTVQNTGSLRPLRLSLMLSS